MRLHFFILMRNPEHSKVLPRVILVVGDTDLKFESLPMDNFRPLAPHTRAERLPPILKIAEVLLSCRVERCRCTKVVREQVLRWCRGGTEVAQRCAEVVWRCRGAGTIRKWCRSRYRGGAELVQRCRGGGVELVQREADMLLRYAEVQRCRGGQMVVQRWCIMMWYRGAEMQRCRDGAEMVQRCRYGEPAVWCRSGAE